MPIVALTGGPRSGRTTAAQSLRFLGYEPVSFGNRLRHMIAMSTGLADTMMLEKADQTFERAITLQAFHIDGMCRLAAAWTTIPDEAPKRMRERAARSALQTPREVMDFVRHDLFEECASPSFWVDAFRAHYEPDKDSNFVVDDAASAVEKQFVRTLGGLILGIARTEGEGDFSECDFVIQNDGGIEQLQDRVISAVVGHYRGVPIQLADAPLPLPLHLVDPSKEEAARQEAESLRKQIDELAARMRTELQARDRKLEEMGAERDALAAKSHEHERALEVLSREAATPNGDATVAMAVAPPQAAVMAVSEEPAPADLRRRETDTAALAARLALAIGLEAGVGKDADGKQVICIDLPAGRVSWVVEEGSYPMLPRYDKAPLQMNDAERRSILLDPEVKVLVSTDQALAREGSDLTVVAGALKDLILLAEGCKIHRAYRAKQAPKGDCPTCWCMWEGTERLRGMTNVYGQRTED